MKNKTNDWRPSPETLVAMEGVEGNKLNGLGDKTFRPPGPSFWHEAIM